MTQARFIIGDTRDVLKKLPDQSVDLVLTSPPFLALRSYLPPDHPDKEHEIGSEATPGEFIGVMLDIVEECDRVLAPHGSLCFELGDTYSGSGGAGGDHTDTGLRTGQEKFNGSALQHRRTAIRNRASGKDGGGDWPLAKSLCMIPELFRISLVYGFNPLTGRETPPWRARNVIRWVRPNAPVGALGDKFRPATSELLMVCKSDKRYFDLDATREPLAAKTLSVRDGLEPSAKNAASPTASHQMTRLNNPAGAPPLDWWSIAPSGYSGSHYAVFPPELCVRPIKAMCPEKVCTVCGKPSERITETEQIATRRTNGRKHYASGTLTEHFDKRTEAAVTTLGWTDCGHDSYRRGVVLDCFGGSRTTGLVAVGHGRDAILIDLDERNADLARERIGLFLTVEDWRPSTAEAS